MTLWASPARPLRRPSPPLPRLRQLHWCGRPHQVRLHRSRLLLRSLGLPCRMRTIPRRARRLKFKSSALQAGSAAGDCGMDGASHVSVLVKGWTWIPDNMDNLYSCRCGLACLWTKSPILADNLSRCGVIRESDAAGHGNCAWADEQFFPLTAVCYSTYILNTSIYNMWFLAKVAALRNSLFSVRVTALGLIQPIYRAFLRNLIFFKYSEYILSRLYSSWWSVCI